MTIKQRALLDVVKMLALGAAAGVAITYSVTLVGAAITGTVVTVAVLAYVSKVCYDIRVSQLQFEQDRIERALKQ